MKLHLTVIISDVKEKNFDSFDQKILLIKLFIKNTRVKFNIFTIQIDSLIFTETRGPRRERVNEIREFTSY